MHPVEASSTGCPLSLLLPAARVAHKIMQVDPERVDNVRCSLDRLK